jgi:hypothetical protein
MAASPESRSGVERLMAQIKPRWSAARHERVFAAILERIRREEGRGAKRPAARSGLRLSHAVR